MSNTETTDPLDDLKTLALGRTWTGPNFYDVAPAVIAEVEALRALVREMHEPACIYKGAGCGDVGKNYPEVLVRALGETNDVQA